MIVGRRRGDRLAADRQLLGDDALGFRVEDRLQREEDVGGRERLAVGPRDARAKVHRVGPAVRRRFPLLRQPRLELEGRAIDSNEPSLREEAEQLRGLLARDEAVERARDGADGGNQLATTRGGLRRRRRFQARSLWSNARRRTRPRG